ncbi:MAG: BlaI/MecI/CopY family transcriptional regulator [Kiritimatiellae bacterium]|jgi:predicted transcriptional regulator|nr:BlaI/MecI/CopY family transcriptional regulator [Kiritimatiellia bacterium]
MKTFTPSPLESRILAILWENPDLTVREVKNKLNDGKTRAYTTVLATMQGMDKKGLVTRNRIGLTDHWSAAVSEESVARPMLTELVGRVLNGRRKLALQYLFEEKAPSSEEIAEMQRLINQAKDGRK